MKIYDEVQMDRLIGAEVISKKYGSGIVKGVEQKTNIVYPQFILTIEFDGDKKHLDLYTSILSRSISFLDNKLEKYVLNKLMDAKDDIEQGNYINTDIIPKGIFVDDEVEREITEKYGDEVKHRLGYCHLFWKTKKRILKEKYNIDWKTPAEMNPHIIFD